ncbi:WYL domain-containing protein, partial [Thioalkalivibrio sp. ALE23]|uniref:WYL domain-containing protein n=1 Tax=Thioalkalivibrio sp. ALE23 TaxID=1265495 RepID=UPI00056E2430
DPDAGFDLDQFIEQGAFDYPEGETIRIELRVSSGLAYHLHEARLSDDQRTESMSDGTSRIIATVRDTAHLKWWLLGLGAGVEVLRPLKLREVMRAELQAAQRPYQGNH